MFSLYFCSLSSLGHHLQLQLVALRHCRNDFSDLTIITHWEIQRHIGFLLRLVYFLSEFVRFVDYLIKIWYYTFIILWYSMNHRLWWFAHWNDNFLNKLRATEGFDKQVDIIHYENNLYKPRNQILVEKSSLDRLILFTSHPC